MNIRVIGAREHNLKNITVEIPRNIFTVITGVSGSGKSSLVFDTIFAEAQREYLESLSTYARRSLPRFSPADVDVIEGLSPSIVVDQKPLARNPRSTVGTATEVYTYLRLLYSRVGKPALSAGDFSFNTPSGACQACTGLGVELAPDLDKLIDWDKSLQEGAILHRVWRVGSRYWNIIDAVELFDMNKLLKDYGEKELETLLYSEQWKYQSKKPGFIQNFSFEGIVARLIKRQKDSRGLESNSYDQRFFSRGICSECQGARVNERARSVVLNGKSIVDLVTMELWDLLPYIKTIKGPIAEAITPHMVRMLEHLVGIGVGYLTLSRSVATLSSGESQKVKLARQLGSALTELIYVLDEPTIGLHARDVERLVEILKQLTAKPNTVLVVEHDESVMRKADYIIDMGPGAGVYGGQVMAQGTPEDIVQKESVTGRYLSGEAHVQAKSTRRKATRYLEVHNARLHNLKNLNVRIPQHVLTCLTGVSGSGKSSLVEVLLKEYPEIIVVDQSPIGRSPRSNPATYVKAFGDIRNEFANATGQSKSLFTFNGEGACTACQGLGYKAIDMHFLGDVRQVCDECQGRRYTSETLRHKYKGKSIADVLDMTIVEAHSFFDKRTIRHKLGLLVDVGLGYLRLGQSSDTLSGGEAQRVKLASRLSKKGDVYVLDEPTRGLHSADIDCLLTVLDRLVRRGNTVVIIEHNLDVIKNADWIIDLGPEGGKGGGEIVVEGTPESVAQFPPSYTGRYLQRCLVQSNDLSK